MLHPSYTDLMKVVNSEVEQGEAPVVNSRYSIVLATSKRARQIIEENVAQREKDKENKGKNDNDNKQKELSKCNKPLSVAIDELYNSKIKIVCDDEE